MYVGHEVSSCGRLARRKTGRLLVVFNRLLVAGWKFPFHPPKGLQGCGVPFVFFVVCLFVYLFIYFWRGGPSTNGQFNQYCVWMGSRLDGGSRGGSGMSREGHGCRCPSPFSAPSIYRGPTTTAHQAQTALQNQGE